MVAFYDPTTAEGALDLTLRDLERYRVSLVALLGAQDTLVREFTVLLNQAKARRQRLGQATP